MKFGLTHCLHWLFLLPALDVRSELSSVNPESSKVDDLANKRLLLLEAASATSM